MEAELAEMREIVRRALDDNLFLQEFTPPDDSH